MLTVSEKEFVVVVYLYIFEYLETNGAFHSTKTSGNSGREANGTGNFPEKSSRILGQPCKVVLKFRKIRTTGKHRFIRAF